MKSPCGAVVFPKKTLHQPQLKLSAIAQGSEFPIRLSCPKTWRFTKARVLWCIFRGTEGPSDHHFRCHQTLLENSPSSSMIFSLKSLKNRKFPSGFHVCRRLSRFCRFTFNFAGDRNSSRPPSASEKHLPMTGKMIFLLSTGALAINQTETVLKKIPRHHEPRNHMGLMLGAFLSQGTQKKHPCFYRMFGFSMK